MRIVWDEPKRLANLVKHGLDLADVIFVEWETALIEASRIEGGRQRFKAIAQFESGTVVVIYVELGREAISVISFRPANPKERKRLDG
ncbi:BrnT family toxin [Aliihoeflea sp. 2WW]|jgi:uncharacterized protein|uniref:BrnT family toxin n=1 Tax=Aliihoeflea sp. 2WW TaxID=1381123 RepID=UPI0004632E33|nr:BrnT family toxin [Aliihoeflea sp. 2WW]